MIEKTPERWFRCKQFFDDIVELIEVSDSWSKVEN